MDLYIEHYLDLHNYINDKICNIGYDGELFIEKKGFNLIKFTLTGLGIVSLIAIFLKIFKFSDTVVDRKSKTVQDDISNFINPKKQVYYKSQKDMYREEYLDEDFEKIKQNFNKI